MQDELKSFGAGIQRLIQGENLTRDETYAMFCDVLTDVQPDLHQGAFLAALVCKGETVEEIAGAWQAIDEVDTVHIETNPAIPLFDNCGTGMDQLKTFNVSSAAAIVAAAQGVTIVRHAARALTSFCGAVDILEAVGVDVECDVEVVENSIRSEGIGLFNGMSSKVHPKALGRILNQIRFGSTLNIAASLAHPGRPTHALRGVYAESMLESVGGLMLEIGYKRAMVVHGKDDVSGQGMDELSITGTTMIRDVGSGRDVELYSLRPEDVGLKTAGYDEIRPTGDMTAESVRFIEVLAGSRHSACIDFTCLNAGAILYAADCVSSIEEGVSLSRDTVMDGLALNKLKGWVAAQNTDQEVGLRRLEEVLSKACV